MSLREQLADIILHNINSTLKSDGSFDKDIIKPILSLFSTAVEEALAQRDEEIKRAIYLLKNIVLVRVNDESYLRVKREEEVNLKNAIEILSHLQETEGK